jgi:hypothetical protein
MMNLGRRSVATLLVLTLFVPFPAPALGQDKVRAATETAWGLHTATFDTPHGKIKVHLPDDLSAGDTISGTVIAEPAGKTEEERIKNQDELNGYVVEIEKEKTPVLGKVLKWAVPAAVGASTYVILRDKRGKELARTQCPIQQPAAIVPPGRPGEPIPPGGRPPFTPQPQPADYQLPTLGQAGQPTEIKGPFNGDFGNTKVEIGGKEAQLLAESPRKVIAQSPTHVTGPTTLKLKEGDVTVRSPLRNVSVSMSATKTTLHKGESATVTVKVEGLRKFDLRQDYELLNPVEIEVRELMRERGMESLPLPKLILHNATPGVVRLEGGDLQTIPIRPEDVSSEGTMTFTRTLTGIRPGGFVVFCKAQQGENDCEKLKEAADKALKEAQDKENQAAGLLREAERLHDLAEKAKKGGPDYWNEQAEKHDKKAKELEQLAQRQEEKAAAEKPGRIISRSPDILRGKARANRKEAEEERAKANEARQTANDLNNKGHVPDELERHAQDAKKQAESLKKEAYELRKQEQELRKEYEDCRKKSAK